MCNVVDCFTPSLGYPVDKYTGERSQLCFQRRASRPVVAGNKTQRAPSPTLAHLNPSRLVLRLKKEWHAHFHERAQLFAAGVAPPLANSTYELLAASAHDAHQVETSVRGFQDLLAGLGFRVPDATVRSFLAEMAGKLPRPPYHDEKIANMRQVQATLSSPAVPPHIRALLRSRVGTVRVPQ